MDYLLQFYAKIFGDGSSSTSNNTPRKIVAFGNVLLDCTARLPDSMLLDRFNISANSKGELDAETLAKITAEACDSSNNCVSNPGGSALNTVRILKHLGTDALFFGAVGDDKPAEELRQILEERNIETRLQTISNVSTGQCICLVHEDNTALYANIGASAKFSIDHLKKAERDENHAFLRPIERQQILYIEGFFVPQREQVCDFIVNHYIRERRRLAINLSAKYIVKENFEHILKLVNYAFFIFGNHNEFQELADKMGCRSLDSMAKKLLQQKDDGTAGAAKVIVITQGGDGVKVISNVEDERQVVPGDIIFQCYHAQRVDEVVDTTGAGDAFVAGFFARLAGKAFAERMRTCSL